MTLLKSNRPDTNVNERERWASLIGGGSLVAFGLTKRDWTGAALAALGGGLILRGVTGHCDFYQALGMNTAHRGRLKGTGQHTSVPFELGIRVDYAIEIDKPVSELFQFWRNLENLPKFMQHLKSVQVIDDRKSHWVAAGPAGVSVDWYAEIVNELEDKLIGWRSLEGSEIDNAGSVRFERSPNGGTRVSVSLQYNPPTGSLGAAVAKLFGADPKKQIQSDMKRFKELMEKGHVSSGTREQVPGGERKAADKSIWDRDKVMAASEESFPASDPPSWTPETV